MRQIRVSSASLRSPVAVLGLLYVCFLATMVFSSAQLPAHVAVHFDRWGHPNGWMTQGAHITFSFVLALVMPLSVAGIFYSLRNLPTKLINIPNRDYWLSGAALRPSIFSVATPSGSPACPSAL